MKLLDKSMFMNIPKNVHIAALLPRLQEEKTKSFTTLVFTLIAVAVFAIFAINPTLSTIADLNKQLDDSKFVSDALGKKISNISSLQQSYTTMQSDIPIIFSSVPTSPEMPFFIAQLQAIANNTQVQLTHAQTLPVELTNNIAPVTTFSSFEFSVDVVGAIENINTFITRVGGFNRVLTIDSITIAKTAGTDNTARLNIKGKTYFKI